MPNGVQTSEPPTDATIPTIPQEEHDVNTPRRRTRYVETLLAPFDRLLDAVERHGQNLRGRVALDNDHSPLHGEYSPFRPPTETDSGEPDRNLLYGVLEQAMRDLVLEPEEVVPTRACPNPAHDHEVKLPLTTPDVARRMLSAIEEGCRTRRDLAALLGLPGRTTYNAATAILTAGLAENPKNLTVTDAGRKFLRDETTRPTYRECEADWWFGPGYEDPWALSFEEICEALFLPPDDVRAVARRAIRVRDAILQKEVA